MAGTLSGKKRARLAREIRKLCERQHRAGDAGVASWHRAGKSLRLDFDGYQDLREAVETLRSVPAWREGYPFDVLATRIVHSLFESETTDEAIGKLLTALDADCKQFVAYAPIFGFNMIDGASIQFGDSTLATLGDERVEAEIIGRLKNHVANLDEKLQQYEIERFRASVAKLKNVPALRVEFFGSNDGSVSVVSPIAERVSSFMQFAIGMLTDQNTHIIDHRGRFTGEFQAVMPVMTVDYDELAFPNVRGIPYRTTISPKDVGRLGELGILAIADRFITPSWGSRNSISSLLGRAISCFSDGERGVTDMARIISYATAVEVFFSDKSSIEESFACGLAAATSTEEEPFESSYYLAKEIYDQRSRAVHDGIEPTFMWVARSKARGAILRMISMRNELTTRKKIRAWVNAERRASGAPCAKPEVN